MTQESPAGPLAGLFFLLSVIDWKKHGPLLPDQSVARAAPSGAHLARPFDCHNETDPMTMTTRFGKKLKIPSTFQIKHQLLLFWLKNQITKEAAEGKTDERVTQTSAVGTAIPLVQTSLAPSKGI